MKKNISAIITAFGLILCSCNDPQVETLAAEFLLGPGFSEPFPVRKDTLFRVENLRSGSLKTDNGWNVQDFAHAFFNPNPNPITIRLEMVCDDPGFVFSDGQTGTYFKTYALKPMFGVTDNVFICPAFEKYGPDWPVSAGTNFTGSVEFTCSDPFYYYLLHPTPASEAETMEEAYFKGWDPCKYDEEGVWDQDLERFIIPYTNYWHNVEIWNVGWFSTLVLRNLTDEPVNYTIRHIPYYGAQYNPENGWIKRFVDQTVIVPFEGGEEKQIILMDLFGWSREQTASMEGCLLIEPDSPEARENGTSLRLLIDPNKSGKPYHPAIP